jgi:hypothetical protein
MTPILAGAITELSLRRVNKTQGFKSYKTCFFCNQTTSFFNLFLQKTSVRFAPKFISFFGFKIVVDFKKTERVDLPF